MASTVLPKQGGGAEYLIPVGGGGSDQNGYGNRWIGMCDLSSELLTVATPNKYDGNCPVTCSTTFKVALGTRKVRFRGNNTTLAIGGVSIGADWTSIAISSGTAISATMSSAGVGEGILEIQ